MNIEDILYHFKETNDISAATVATLEENKALREALIAQTRLNHNREFALTLLNKCIELRKDPDAMVTGDTIMLACYNLGLHNHIEDCLKVWEAKEIDFDTHCYIDIQLVVFAGVNATIDFLEKQPGDIATEALNYIRDCSNAGDFKDLVEYYDPNTYPWFL